MKYIAMCNLTLQLILIYDQYEDYFENILFMNDVLKRERILHTLCFIHIVPFIYRCALRLAVTRLNGRTYTVFSNVFSSTPVSVAP